jgi:hypothetical protein
LTVVTIRPRGYTVGGREVEAVYRVYQTYSGEDEGVGKDPGVKNPLE